MQKTIKSLHQNKSPDDFKKSTLGMSRLLNLAFDNSLQPTIISNANTREILMVNNALCKLLGYTKRELLQNRVAIFNKTESNFKKMELACKKEGKAIGLLSLISKNGQGIICEVTSAIFMDGDGVEKSVTTITDMSHGMQKQKIIDAGKEKIVADNILLALLKQKGIDVKKDKLVADNIVLALLKQKGIDVKNDKKVADNIVAALARQNSIDIKNKKIVADNILLALVKQKGVDAKNKKIVADNIVFALLKQKGIDRKNKKVVADNILLALDKQKGIDKKNEKTVAGNILLALLKQKGIDVKNEKIVASNILAALSKQKGIDVRNKKTVADNIIIALARQKTLDIKNEKVVSENILLAKTTQKKIDIKKERIVAHNILLALSKQKRLDVEKEKVVADNILQALAESDAKLAVNNEWINYISKTSFDVMWDWNISSGRIYLSDSAEEMFGYKIPSNTISLLTFFRCLAKGEKIKMEKAIAKAFKSSKRYWEINFDILRKDGSVATAISRANIVRDGDGKALRLIGTVQDVSRLQYLGQQLGSKLTAQTGRTEIFLAAAKLSFDGIWDWNLQNNDFFIGEGFQELFGYSLKKNMGNINSDWANYLHPDDKNKVEKKLRSTIASKSFSWEDTYRFIKADGSMAKVFNRATIFRDGQGKAYRMIGAMQDISKHKALEEQLAQEIKMKELQIAAATEAAKEMERADLGKELHDNINQLLGASRLYLEMAKKGGENTENYLSRSSEYTLTAIEDIRKLTHGLALDTISNRGLWEAIRQIVHDTMELNPIKISCFAKGFVETGISKKFKLNIYRIVQEQMNNILKHAKATNVIITLSKNKNNIILSISDNGIGFDVELKNEGIGLDNIKSRALAYNGLAEFISHSGKGCSLTVMFPAEEASV